MLFGVWRWVAGASKIFEDFYAVHRGGRVVDGCFLECGGGWRWHSGDLRGADKGVGVVESILEDECLQKNEAIVVSLLKRWIEV